MSAELENVFCQLWKNYCLCLYRGQFPIHCESGEGLWIQGKAALQTHSFRDAEPHQVIPQNAKKNYGTFPMQLTPDISTSLSTTDLCLPSTTWQRSVVCYYRICQFEPRTGMEYSLLCICLCLTVWLCHKMSSENMVLVRVLQIEAKDLTVHRKKSSLRLNKTSATTS